MRSRYQWKVIWLAALIAVFAETSLLAKEKTPTAIGKTLSAEPAMSEIIINWVDIVHAAISKHILNTVQRLDAFFGDERIDEERQNTQFKMVTAMKLSANQPSEWTFPISTNLALPHLENRVHLFMDTLLKENKKSDVPEDPAQKTNLKVGLSYLLLKKARQWVNVDGGVKVSGDRLALGSLEPFATLRFRGTTDFDPWALRLTHFVNWFKNEGFSAISRIDLEKRISSQTLFRLTNYAEWTESEQGTILTQTILLRRQFSEQRAIGIDLSSVEVTRAPSQVEQYDLNFMYRRRLYKNWVFGTIEPGVQFLRDDHFKRNPFLFFTLEIQFGRISE